MTALPSLSEALINEDVGKPVALLKQAGFHTAALSLMNSMLGAGILAYPYAYMSSGTVMGTMLALVIGCLSFMSIDVIFKSMVVASFADDAVQGYGDLVGAAFGRRSRFAVDALLVVYAYGACVGYLILLGDLLTPVVLVLTPHASEEGTWRVVLCFVTIVCLCLCLMRTVSALKYSAVVGVIGTSLFVVMLVLQTAEHPCREGDCADECGLNGWCTAEQAAASAAACDTCANCAACAACDGTLGVSRWPQSPMDVLRSLPLLAFALQCHIQAPAIFVELPTPLRAGGATRAIAAAATGTIVLLYLPVGLCGFLRFGAATQGDVLKNFDVGDAFADASRAALALTALASFPMQHFPARTALWNFWRLARPARDDGTMRAARGPPMSFIAAEAVAWAVLVLGLAELVGSSLANVFQLVGAVCGSTVIFTLPGAIWLKLGPRDDVTRPLVGGLLLAVGLFILATGTEVTIQQMFEGSPPPRVCGEPYNGTAAA